MVARRQARAAGRIQKQGSLFVLTATPAVLAVAEHDGRAWNGLAVAMQQQRLGCWVL